MKAAGLLIAVIAALIATDVFAQVRVKGYYRKDGTYVAPHYRSSPNSSKFDNYSTQGNYNPYTGKRGTVNPYAYPAPAPVVPTYTAPAATYRPTYAPAPDPRTGTRWWASDPVPEDNVESARAAVNRLEEEWQRTDPFYEHRIAILRTEVGAISALPPSQWAATLEQRYWAIPATKVSAHPSAALLAQYTAKHEQCEAVDSARSDLEYETRRLLRCAQSGSYTDDCSSEARRVRNAAEDLENAVSEAGYLCE